MIAAVILSAGLSRRFGSRDKLMERIGGETMVAITARRAVLAGFHVIVAVYSSDDVRDEIESAVRRAGFKGNMKLVRNDAPEAGQAISMKLGISVLPEGADGAMFMTGDQPMMGVETVKRLMDAFRGAKGCGRDAIVIPVDEKSGAPSSPVTFGKSFFSELMDVEGDRGGRDVVRRHEASSLRIGVSSGELADIDEEKDAKRLSNIE